MVEQKPVSSEIDFREGEPETRQTVQSGPEMTVYIKNLFEAAQGLIEQTITPAQFENLLSKMEARLKNAFKAVREVPKVSQEIIKEIGRENAEKMHSLLTEAHSEYKEGLEIFSQGLSLFRDFSENVTVEMFEKAKQTLWRGVSKLQSSQRIIEKEFMQASK